MRDKILYALYKLGENKFIRGIYLAYYQLAIWSVKRMVKKLSFVEHAYLKGSWNKDYFVPVVSDLDFFLCGDVSLENQRILARKFQRLNVFFPMVSDFDFHSYFEMDYLRNFSGIKYLDSVSWITLKGEPIGQSYQYNPRKFCLGVIHEIYFQMEWVFKNLKKRKKKEAYITLCIERQFVKIYDLLKYLDEDYLKDFAENRHPQWSDFSNEQIIREFNQLIWNCDGVKRIHDVYLNEIDDLKLEKILQETYYQTELVFIDNDFSFSGKLHYFTREVFELFFYTGCVDSYIMFHWIEKHHQGLSRYYIKTYYFSKLIEKRHNLRHDQKFLTEHWDQAIEAKNLIYNHVKNNFNRIRPEHYLSKNICILSFWNLKQKDLKLLANFIKKSELENDCDVFVACTVDVSVKAIGNNSSDKFKVSSLLIQLDENEYYPPNQQMQLFNLALDWCFGARMIYLWDKAFAFKASEILSKTEEKQHNCDFLALDKNMHKIMNRPFLWMGYWDKWRKLSALPSINQEVLNNEIFRYLLTGKTNQLYDVKKVLTPEIVKNRLEGFNPDEIDYFPDEILKIDDKKRFNQMVLMSGLLHYLISISKPTKLGFYAYDTNNEYYSKVDYFIQNRENLSASDIIFQIKMLKKYGLFKAGEYFNLKLSVDSENTVTSFDEDVAILNQKSENSFELLSASEKQDSTFSLYYEHKLSSVPRYGLYLTIFQILPEKAFQNETLEMQIAPNGIQDLEQQLNLDSLSTDQIYVINWLDRESKYIGFKSHLKFKANLSYTFLFSKSMAIDDVNFQYYKKLNSSIVEALERGLYKSVLNFSDDVTGEVEIKDKAGVSLGRSVISSASQGVIYFPINIQKKNKLSFSMSHSLKDQLIEIDLLKATTLDAQ